LKLFISQNLTHMSPNFDYKTGKHPVTPQNNVAIVKFFEFYNRLSIINVKGFDIFGKFI